ncbi:MAG: tyrosine recombinase XerC [Gammaproteobacteria bacterium]|nr:tyrosine recombinase XerC [Rhodocyclaceae bacterium]MBU3910707.1 tyrosine recombinase XerC [Gammaproteobacteria bacterium]MBU3988507.1 tyrosine recombinase XerC [Gammaproteobacteria bacterium]MBU4003416.1 tyrosine recombinase XerC [Gammaproteobacteria bacterium]MBU4021887.1 tyrosine recombinase XerC [Gammaproteobacteria bacterium]
MAEVGKGPAADPGVEQFLAELAHQRRASIHTLTAYRRDLLLLQDGTGSRPLAQLQSHELRRQAMRLHGQGLSARSLARTLSAWRSYYRWLARRGVLTTDPCAGLRAPKRPRALPKVLGIDQAAALLAAPGDDWLAVRDRAMFELFYSSGLRLAELAALDMVAGRQGAGGLDLSGGEVTVTGKRAKTRTVPVGAKAVETLNAWLEQRVAIAAENETALFVSRRGTRLSPRAIELRLAHWAKKSGLGLHVHPHMLRHSFASHVLQSSGDLRAVQEMLGHASISTTQIYTHLDFQHLAKVYDAAHPRAKKK